MGCHDDIEEGTVEKHKICVVACPPPNQLQMISLHTFISASDWWRKPMPNYWPSGHDGKSLENVFRFLKRIPMDG